MTNTSPVHPILRGADVHRVRYTEADRELFDRFLGDFVPPDAFDAHAHLYDLRHLVPPEDFAGPDQSPTRQRGPSLAGASGWCPPCYKKRLTRPSSPDDDCP